MALTAPTSLVLSGATCLLYRTPLLYIWRRGEDVLYVGKSRGGIARPLHPDHHRTTAMEPDDELELLLRPYTCTMGLLSEEARLITRLQPRFNNQHIDRSPVTAHPDDCPLSGEHVQREREEVAAAAATEAAAIVQRERERAMAEAELREPVESSDRVAVRLGVSRAQVDEWLDAGAIPSVELFGRRHLRRIRQRDLRAFALDRGLSLDQAVAV